MASPDQSADKADTPAAGAMLSPAASKDGASPASLVKRTTSEGYGETSEQTADHRTISEPEELPATPSPTAQQLLPPPSTDTAGLTPLLRFRLPSETSMSKEVSVTSVSVWSIYCLSDNRKI